MRKIFMKTLMESARGNKNIFLLTGDLGYSVLEPFRDEFPDRFINMGIAEQNMIGVAAGLALSGKLVLVYSIVPFVTLRCFEQIRNDLCYQNLNVKLIGIGGGVQYGTSGSTHFSLEDFGVLRTLPHMAVLNPADAGETEMALRTALDRHGPAYIRISRLVPPIPRPPYHFKIGSGYLILKGKDICIIATGSMLATGYETARLLQSKGLHVSLISMPSLKPFDSALVKKMLAESLLAVTIEEHGIIGGLSSAVSEVMAGMRRRPVLRSFALSEDCFTNIGTQSYMLEQNSLTPPALCRAILKDFKKYNEKRK